MNNTIEPRLIALLNDAPSELYSISPSLELPPLHDPNILKASGRPLLLEPDASKRNGKPSTNLQLASKHKPLIPPLDDDETTQKGSEAKQKHGKSAADRTLGNSSPQSLRKILDNDTNTTVAITSKKRNIVEISKDDFVQLPQPPKKQKAAKQVVPPIIIGLFEPPPQAALFPPIASSSFHDSHGRNSLNTVLPKVTELKDDSRKDSSNDKKAESSQTKAQKKDVRPRKKWTEEETAHLLLGVHTHGVGNWTDILEDSSYSFNGRSAIDLKDRFRTCCPAELRGKAVDTKSSQGPDGSKLKTKSKSSLMSENILIEDDEIGPINASGDANVAKQRKSRAHRKKLEDLAQLGIEGPFQKSRRRERRPFSEEEDRAILEGYEIYGPAWTRIQRDPRLNLQSRQPTDLRDRFRNKHPEKFRSEDKADSGKPSLNRSSPSFPSTDSPLPLQNHTSMFNFKDTDVTFGDQTGMDSSDSLPYTQSFDWNPGISAPFSNNIGEMDISRLLLDESWPDIPSSSSKEKQTYNDINSIITSSAEPLHNGPSFFNMLNDPDQIDDPFA
ncbi:uncharacterized protein K444DRAFT_592795 [Hyaloscypha bicolor E]|uniref:Myb-like domain-containing protein n=1 Tax=Hyaloscypha bicolor E TaxID=1095630 RepID=A0A2J6T371_9HELO|nr:uncharacterized protein K444DRAFT_592795 [Hyaloscypha bicolor E]PMD57462.1 hypothetical protein K444DRAFT_592795 [Hyaloscypha bicolor E]